MSHNNTKASRHFLFSALFGILVFIAVFFLQNIPEQIQQGQQGATAIQLLNAMRRPILALEEADLKSHLSLSEKDATQANFEENVAIAQDLINRYHNASRYNPELAKNVDTLNIVIHDWIQAKRKHINSDESIIPISRHLIENHQRLLHALKFLAAGEAPIHQDIKRGQDTERLIQWSAAILLSYLLLLFILSQHFRQQERFNNTYRAVEQTQAELQQRENYLSLTLNSIGDAVITTNEKGRIIHMNPVAETLTGWQQEEANGLPLPDVFRIVNAHSREPVDNPVEKVLSRGQVVGLANHTVLIAKNDCEYQIADSGAPIMDNKGKILGVILIFRDVTEEYRQQDYLENEVENRIADLNLINQELESFSYSISHDLRAPLRAINGFAIALSEDYADNLDDTANDYLHRISAGTNRMSTLIDDLLMLSRINRRELNISTCDLSAMANEIRQQLAEQYPRDDVQWQIQEQLSASCDDKLIYAALENMFNNALKYSGKKDYAVIEFGCKQQDGKKIFYIRDNGAGFNMQYVDKLFGAFQRLHGKEFDGTGIGLATVQRIIHRHGGKIWADGEVDKGATFYFTLD